MSTADPGDDAAQRRVSAVHRVAMDRLTGDDLDIWLTLRAENPALDSPYFHPGFSAAVHASGRAVTVVVGQDDAGAVRAFLPCQRDGSLLRPAGWPAVDFQAPILAPGWSLPPSLLLTGGVKGFAFDHLLASCEASHAFVPWIESTQTSPFIDVSGGLDEYLNRASRSGKDNIAQARRKATRAERTIGPVRFLADVVDAQALERVIDLKRAQYAATGVRDYFERPERRDLMVALMHTRDPAFAGILSTMHVGQDLVAAHFGLRSGSVLHWWFPVYDPAFSSLSPGWMLLRELIMAAPDLGITRIDLGCGDDEYKRRAKTGETCVSQGLVTRSAARLAVRRARRLLVSGLKDSPLGPGLRHAARTLRTRGRQART